MSTPMEELRAILAEVSDLQHAAQVLSWDQVTYMPPGGVQARAQQLTTLRRLAHVRLTADEVGRLLDTLEPEMESADPDSDEASLVRVTRREYDRQRRLPAELVAAISEAGALGRAAWAEARRQSDFAAFAPFLQTNVDLNRRLADTLGYDVEPYDALLDRGEPGMTAGQLRTLFAELRAAIVPLLRAIGDRDTEAATACLHRRYDEQKQLAFGLEVVQRFGYDLNRGREDLTAHPFCTTFGPGDVRITTRVYPDFLSAALFGTMHESGHGMYEQGVDPALARTPLARGASPGMHESQSRLWENLVGRSRPFWAYWFPRLQATFPEQLGDVDGDAFYRAVNTVSPSLIRVEADEVTYNLHILVRFELELALLDGSLTVPELPEAWNARMQEYIGRTPPNDSLGVLQDVHWSGIGFGSFPSYTLGNVIGAQLFAQARQALPDLDGQIAAGDFSALHGWLQTNLYRHGRKLTPNALLERITGGPLSAAPWIAYVRRKFDDLYGIAAG